MVTTRCSYHHSSATKAVEGVKELKMRNGALQGYDELFQNQFDLWTFLMVLGRVLFKGVVYVATGRNRTRCNQRQRRS
jgi:hypothetical protein